jgi:hypothetical protein
MLYESSLTLNQILEDAQEIVQTKTININDIVEVIENENTNSTF